MMRRELPFPKHNDYELCNYLKECWEQGLFDEYSDEHFIVKAIENRLTTFVGFNQMLENEPNLHGIVLSKGIIDNTSFNANFCLNLSNSLSCLASVFGKDKIEKFITDQLSAGKGQYNEDAFFEALSEISILFFYARRAKWEQAIYEPPVNISGSVKNPEAKFVGNLCLGGSDSIRFSVNIEVKCPKFPSLNSEKRIAIPTIMLSQRGRELVPEFCKNHDILYLSPRLLKLKDFLNSASEKFSVPKENEYNLLYINWSYCDFPSNSFLEAWSLLTNDINGILTHPDVAQRIGVSNDIFQKITAVIVYTEALEGLMFSDFRNVWQQNGQGQRFRMWILNNDLREAEISRNSDKLFNITGMKPTESLTQMVMLDCKSQTDSDLAEAGMIGVELANLIGHNADS